MAFYQQQPFYNPRIPFSGPIQGGLQDGKIIIISGRVLPGANRFHINLQCGSHSGADVALHFNPRYDGSAYVVKNTYQNRNWGSEERKYESPFPQGQTFTLQILVTQDAYKISANGRHFVDFKHRIPFSRVDTIAVEGMVELNSVAFQNPAPYLPPQPAFPGYSQPHAGFQPQFAVPPGCGFQPQYAVPPGCGFPAYPSAPSYTVPYKTVINGGLQPGKNIVIHGMINPNASRIDFNLCYASGIAFHYNPRFDENLVVRNNKQMESWGPEDRSGGMPFQRGQPFQVTISCNHHHFNVFVNGKQAHTFKHRYAKLRDIDILEVNGDLQLTLVQA
ncbi:galectin-9-like isoform X1 [Pimephales promelas]|uniref:galectin-9-like isoform X1 n=1 Tax=Pimephales promelas TaxID=90988 RepID=UPI0019559843|nr:galectin-9-like isoform X1 [Pimephales promelas]KAG1951854.1 lectin, galactoside-binding, soluble, 9 (galectin 9)-like [Pimephales promelas]